MKRRSSHHPASGRRPLRVEALESRRLLAASAELPWQNYNFRLDVNDTGSVNSSDMLALINRMLSEGVGPLPVPPPGPVAGYYDTTGDNRINSSDLLAIINGLLKPPEVQLSTLAPFTSDLTPELMIAATAGGATLPDGALVEVDLDLDGDGYFSGEGERNHTLSWLWQGRSQFDLNDGLQVAEDVYQVTLQARVQDLDGVRGTSAPLVLEVDTRSSSALADYVNASDDSYSWQIFSETHRDLAGAPYKYFVLQMNSQTWRSEADVNLPLWHHWLEVYVPTDGEGDFVELDPTALLFIRGGSNTSTPPVNPSIETAAYATENDAVVAVLRIVPNEPVVFTDETSSRTEDEIIAYTLDKYLGNLGQPDNETWPLLLPMVKSAVRAMDTVQALIPQRDVEQSIDSFVVSGESKRGWTTWLTAAADDRVRAIIPGVFDNLNQAPQMVNHYAVLGKFSEQVHDYTDLDIFERILTPEAQLLGHIVDPYSYLRNGRFDDMPKLILNSAGDEFFVPDSSRFYIHDLPGTQNYLRYIPNTGHGLNEQAVSSRRTFFDAVLHDRALPEFSWHVDPDGSIHVQAATAPTQVLLWQVHNPVARDFRHGYNPQYVWTSSVLVDQGGGSYFANVDVPETGAIAYLVELTFPNAVPGGEPYVFTTEARIKSGIPRAEWPYLEIEPFESDRELDTSAIRIVPGGNTDLSSLPLAVSLESQPPELATSALEASQSPALPEPALAADALAALLAAPDWLAQLSDAEIAEDEPTAALDAELLADLLN